MNSERIGLYFTKVGMTNLRYKENYTPVTVMRLLDFNVITKEGKFADIFLRTKYGKLKNPQVKLLEKAGILENTQQINATEEKNSKSDKNKGKTEKKTVVKGVFRKVDAVAAQKGIELFTEGDLVDVQAKTRGHGFAGCMKRHGFSGGRASHGETKAHRTPGSTGQQNTERVFKNKRMPGRMGNKKNTIQNLKVIKIEKIENNTYLFLKGATPGYKGEKFLSFVSLGIKTKKHRSVTC